MVRNYSLLTFSKKLEGMILVYVNQKWLVKIMVF
jgi:hypothetical protein